LGLILVHVSQMDTINIEQGFALGHRNLMYLQEEEGGGKQDTSTTKIEVAIRSKTTIEPECETKKVPEIPQQKKLSYSRSWTRTSMSSHERPLISWE
jgi:hypothetical protein